jgi:hypothetical protein
MNPLLARADELEKQRRQAEMLRGMTAGMSPAMTTQMTDEQRAILEQQAAQDPATKEAMMAEMLRTGSDALFNTGVAEGKTIGDIYVAPTWSEALNAAAKQGIGGYQMGKARGGLEEAQATRNEASNAKGTLSNAIAKEERDQRDFENQRLTREEDRKNRELEAETEANRIAQEKLDARQKIEDERWAISNDRAAAAEVRAQEKADRLAAKDTAKEDDQFEGLDIDSVSKRRLKQEESVFNQINNIYPKMTALEESGKSAGKPILDFAIEKAQKIPLIGGEVSGNIVSNLGYSKEEQQVRGDVDKATEAYRRAFTGANLTATELGLGKDWDPTARGLTTAQKVQRLRDLQNVMNENRTSWGLSPLGVYDGTQTPLSEAGASSEEGSVSSQKPVTEADIDNMTEEELRANGLI